MALRLNTPWGYFILSDAYGRMTQLKTYRDEQLTTPDITTWAYHAPTGLLTSKAYADSKAVTYTYSADGKLATRTWARFGVPPSGGLLTSYSYNAATGELVGIDYADATSDIAFTYNRLGQQLTVADVVGTRTFAYNDKLAPSTETITGLYAKTLTRTYDALGRESALSIDAGYSLGYGYDMYGRYNALSMGANTVTLGYAAGSDLVGGITRSNGVDTAFGYEANRDLVTQVAHAPAPPADPMAVYGYTNDAIGRRTAMSKAGTAFVQADTISYGYNDRSEVVSAVSANLATYDYGYGFDPIGNRLTAASSDPSDPSDVSYASNSLNQYTAITEDQDPPFNPAYDDDGNCTSAAFSTGTWTATWNCENRMVAIEKANQKLEFSYDYMGRRVEKKVYTGSTGNWTLASHLRFVYNGYRLAQVLNALSAPANGIIQEFAWSLDDELRLVRDGEDVYFVHHDANRNVTELTDATGALAAHYEYAPFGKLTAQSGAYASTNPFRFSSEYFDAETGLVYYNYRYYSPELGRWMSRDPEGEGNGNWNRYNSCWNNLLYRADYLGLWWSFYKWLYTGDGYASDEVYDAAKEVASDSIVHETIPREQAIVAMNYYLRSGEALGWDIDSDFVNKLRVDSHIVAETEGFMSELKREALKNCGKNANGTKQKRPAKGEDPTRLNMGDTPDLAFILGRFYLQADGNWHVSCDEQTGKYEWGTHANFFIKDRFDFSFWVHFSALGILLPGKPFDINIEWNESDHGICP